MKMYTAFYSQNPALLSMQLTYAFATCGKQMARLCPFSSDHGISNSSNDDPMMDSSIVTRHTHRSMHYYLHVKEPD